MQRIKWTTTNVYMYKISVNRKIYRSVKEMKIKYNNYIYEYKMFN